MNASLEIPMARRSKTAYRKKYFALIVAMSRKGNTNREIAQALGVHYDTLYAWYKKYEGLREAADVAREGRVREVEAAFFKRAIGYTTQVREVEIDPSDPQREKILSVKVKDVERPPSVTAGMFILTNKLAGEYKNRSSHEITGRVGVKHYVAWSPESWLKTFPEWATQHPRIGGNGGDGKMRDVTPKKDDGNGTP